MSETITEKAVCGKCGVDLREGTTFCYNCGAKVEEIPVVDLAKDVDEAIPMPTADDLTEPGKVGEGPDDGKHSRAADERRKARSGLRRSKQYTWEPSEDSRFPIIASVVIAVIAFTVVFVTVLWK